MSFTDWVTEGRFCSATWMEMGLRLVHQSRTQVI